MEWDLYATIYLDADMDKPAVVRAVAEIAGGPAAGTTIVTELAEIFVLDNEDFIAAGSGGGDDARRRCRYCLEIEPLEHVDVLAYKAKIATLLADLREAGFRAVLPGDSGERF